MRVRRLSYRRPCFALCVVSRGRQLAHVGAGSPLGGGEVELRLEIQPELGCDAEPVPEPQGGIAGHGTLAGDNLADSVGWHGNLTREDRLANDNSASSSFRISPG